MRWNLEDGQGRVSDGFRAAAVCSPRSSVCICSYPASNEGDIILEAPEFQ
jgi:hypothetical protein